MPAAIAATTAVLHPISPTEDLLCDRTTTLVMWMGRVVDPVSGWSVGPIALKAASPGDEQKSMSVETTGEGRLFERVVADGLEVEWDLKPRRVGPKKRKLVSKETAVLLDVSVGGACVLAPIRPRFVVGNTVTIGLDGSAGLVRVRWVRARNETDSAMYGVDFVDLDPELHARLTDPVNERRSGRQWDGWAPDLPPWIRS